MLGLLTVARLHYSTRLKTCRVKRPIHLATFFILLTGKCRWIEWLLAIGGVEGLVSVVTVGHALAARLIREWRWSPVWLKEITSLTVVWLSIRSSIKGRATSRLS